MRALDLAYRSFGGEEHSPPVVLLHGLLGSSRNWQSAARLLTRNYRVLAPDLRNHGESPHDAVMDYSAMTGDVINWLDSQSLNRVHLVGHSMGGKVAMNLACQRPERVRTLTVVDIAPRAYEPRWDREFTLLQRMPVGQFSRRLEAEQWLEQDIRDWAFRKFLVSNLERCPESGFKWSVNLEVLKASLPNLFIRIPPEGWRFDGRTLFLRGANSSFIEEKDIDLIRQLFPFAKLKTIENAGHNVHFDQPEAFYQALDEFMNRSA